MATKKKGNKSKLRKLALETANVLRLLTVGGLTPYGQPVYGEGIADYGGSPIVGHMNPLTGRTVPYGPSFLNDFGKQWMEQAGVPDLPERLSGRPRASRAGRLRARTMRGLTK